MVSITEPTLNVAMAEVLRRMRNDWNVDGEPAGKALSKGRPDIVITEKGVSSVAIETEFVPAGTVEKDAKSRLGVDYMGSEISTAIAIRVPVRLKEFQGKSLRNELRNAQDLEYSVYSTERFPKKGWMTGGLANIAMASQVMALPRDKIKQCVDIVEGSIEAVVSHIDGLDESLQKRMADVMKQNPDEQTWKMVGLILSNALVFYDTISGRKGIKSISDLKEHGVVSQGAMIEALDHVLEIDYFPIFDIARRILSMMNAQTALKILKVMVKAADDVIRLGMTRSFDMYGSLFQRMISDRKLLAAFYTLPESAALMASLLVPPPSDNIWQEKNLKKFKLADFACGTGTILTHVYKKMIVNYEINGRDMGRIHPHMMESGIIGFDVVPLAAHLTVSAIASIFPKREFDKTAIHTLHFGVSGDVCSLGSLDLIDDITTLDVAGKRVLAKGEEDIMHPGMLVADDSCDIIAMNPPFVRNTNHEGRKYNIPVPAFSSGNTIEEQEEMARTAKRKFRDTCANGNAGVASNFVAIADKKLAREGVMGIVLPATVVSGSSWQGVRDLVARNYDDVKVISIAERESTDPSFSSDTGMAEIILVARKRAEGSSAVPRGRFISIYERPGSVMESIELGNAMMSRGRVIQLEDGARGGTPLQMGDTPAGNMLDCPLDGDWMFVNIVDPVLAQCAYQLRQGLLILPHQKSYGIKTTIFDKIAESGPISRDISGRGRGPFDISNISDTALYPTLWNGNSKEQTSMMVRPDKMATPKPDSTEEKIQKIWDTATRLHVNINVRYTSQALCFAYTGKDTIGGGSWPSIILNDRRYEKSFAVWGTSTLGILCFWSDAGKQQLGRGRTSGTGIISMPVLDFGKLSKDQIESFDRIFDRYSTEKLKPIKYLYDDEVRKEIDKEMLEALNIDASLDDLRERLCREPSMSGGKIDAGLRVLDD